MTTTHEPDHDTRGAPRGVEAAALLRKYLPNAGANTWTGAWPLEDGEPRPDDGVPVVYRLWEAGDEAPAYVGSSEHFAQRLRAHTRPVTRSRSLHTSASRAIDVARWQADRCPSTTAARHREGQLIADLAPRLNRTTGGIHYSRADWERYRDAQRAAPADPELVAYAASLDGGA